MKIIKYKIATEINCGTEENPDIKVELQEKTTSYSGYTEKLVLEEAYNGEYEIVDDVQPDPEPTAEEQLRSEMDELKAALNMILSGVTE